MNPVGVRIVGGGAAAAIAARALHGQGVVRAPLRAPESVPRPTHYVTLNEPTLFLLNDLFGPGAIRAIYGCGNPISERVVRWDGVEIHRTPARGVLLCASDLADCLEAWGNPDNPGVPDPIPADSIPVFARGRRHNDGQPVGPRFAFQWTGLPLPRSGGSVSYTIAVKGGWGMYAGTPDGGATLQVVTPQAESLHAGEVALRALGALTELGALHAADLAGISLAAARPMPAAPQLSSAFEVDALAIGDELMSLDPLSGDGIGHCLRTAVLFEAFASRYGVHRLRGNPSVANRIQVAFGQHLLNCERFYSRIYRHQDWEGVIDASHVRRIEIDRGTERRGASIVVPVNSVMQSS